jgi:hypothetical protein
MAFFRATLRLSGWYFFNLLNVMSLVLTVAEREEVGSIQL